MTDTKAEDLMSLFSTASDRLHAMKDRLDKQDSMPADEILKFFEEHGVPVTKQDIIDKYAELKEYNAVVDYFYGKYEKQMDRIDDLGADINSDAFVPMVQKIVKENFDPVDFGDTGFITDLFMKLEDGVPKDQIQPLYTEALQGIISYGRRTGKKLEEADDFYDYNGCLKEWIRDCHERTPAFRQLFLELYDLFPDADPKIFPSVYKEWKEKRK